MSSSNYLFVYGTLRRNHAPSEVADIMKSLEFVSEGTAPGYVVDFGDYPGAVFEPHSTSVVQGEVFKLPKSPQILKKLDRYEEFQPSRPRQSLFIREIATVETSNGEQLNCWVYRINTPAPKKRMTQKRSIRRVTAPSKRVAR